MMYLRNFLAAIYMLTACADDGEMPTQMIEHQSSPKSWPILPNQYGVVLAGLSADSFLVSGTWVQVDEAAIRRIVGYARQSGATVGRHAFYWDEIQVDRDTWNTHVFNRHQLVVQAMVDSGLTPFVTLVNVAPWACWGDRQASCIANPNQAPDDFNAWQGFVSSAVAAFPDVEYWGIWNEPVSSMAFRPEVGLVQSYKELLIYASQAIRSAGKYVVAIEEGEGSSQ